MKIKFTSLVVAAICTILFGWILLSCLGIVKNLWSWDVSQTSLWWSLLVAAICVPIIVYVQRLIKGELVYKSSHSLLLIVLFTVAVGASTGFKFTAGDIGQRITPFNNAGQVVDKEVLYEYYDVFYHFSEKPELKSYVETYGELPGRNNNNALIRTGQIPRSTAPRADEDFKWHGSTDNKIYQSNK